MKQISLFLAVFGLVIGSLLNISSIYSSSVINIENDENRYTFEEVSCEGAGCSNMFMESDNCKDTPANCCEGGTGYSLSCSINCDSGSTINCGKEDTDPGEHASLLETPCTIES